MDSDSDNEWPNPKRLKTLAAPVAYNLLHQIVLDHSPPHQSHSKSDLNAYLLTLSSTSLNVNALNDEGYSPLHLAVLKNNLLMVQKLLSCLANIDVDTRCHVSRDSNTALHLAAKLGHAPITEELLHKGADVDMQNRDRDAALCLAAESGDLDIIKLLVSKGANVHLMSRWGEALHCADRSGNLAIVEFLVSHGADVNAKSRFREGPLHGAA